MSSKLGTLTLDLVTKIGNFVGPIKDGEKQVKVSFENMRKHVNTYGTAVAAIGASAVTALAGMAVQTANQAAELERFAFRANTTTQEFQKMAVGAQAYGIEQEKLSDMMKDFNEKLGELTTIGAGGGVDFFEQIAVKTEGGSAAAKKLILDMQKLSGPEALQMYVDKLEEAGVTQQQMSFYLESMASDMTDLIPLLVNGGEGMQLYGDLAERAGIIMSDKTMESAKLLKDQVYMLDLQLQGAKNQLMQAVIPAFIDIADAFFSGSEQGIQFTDVAEGIANGLRYIAKVAIGAATAVQLTGKAIGGLAAVGGAIATGDFAEAKSLGSIVLKDLQDTSLAAAEKMERVDNSIASSTAKRLATVRQIGASTNGVTAGLDELVKKQDKVAGATAKSSKAASEFNQVLQEQQRIIRDYSTGDRQGEIDLEKEIQRLRKNNMAEYIPLAEARYQQEKKLNDMRNAFELVEHRLTQNQKLAYSYNIKEQEIKADAKLTKEQQQAKLQSLREQYNIEVNETRIAQQKQLLEAKRNWMTAEDYASQYYALVREEILNTAEYSPQMKEVLIRQANSQQGIAENAEREAVWEDYQWRFGVQKTPYQNDMDLLAEARKQMLITEEDYQKQKLNLQISYGSAYVSDFAGMLMGMVDQSSTAYRVLYGIQKGFNLAQAVMNGYTAISAAWASAPFPYNLPAVAATTMETGVLQAAIQAVTPVGMAHDGIDNIPKEGTWLLDGGERVLNPQQNKDLTRFLADNPQNQQGGGQVAIYNMLDQDEIVGEYVKGRGWNVIMNQLKANSSDVKRALGV